MATKSTRTSTFLLGLQLDQLGPHLKQHYRLVRTALLGRVHPNEQHDPPCTFSTFYELALGHMCGGLQSSEGGGGWQGKVTCTGSNTRTHLLRCQMTAIEY